MGLEEGSWVEWGFWSGSPFDGPSKWSCWNHILAHRWVHGRGGAQTWASGARLQVGVAGVCLPSIYSSISPLENFNTHTWNKKNY